MRSAYFVRSVAASMPLESDIQPELMDAAAAQGRGYFLPDEDERLRDVFVRYLSLRQTLVEVVIEMQGVMDRLDRMNEDVQGERVWGLRMRAFVVGFLAAAMLRRAASFIVDLAAKRSVVRKKLDEPEPRYGIPAKSFAMIYKSLGSHRSMWRFSSALRFYKLNHEDIGALVEDPLMKDLMLLFDREINAINFSRRGHFSRKILYRLYSLKRRHVSGYKKVMFQLLKLSGRAVSEIKQPFVKATGEGKRVDANVLASLRPILRAGDVLITRHDDAMSNLFLPGYWPHAALYIGDADERGELGLRLPDSAGIMEGDCHFLEAKKDGVFLRPIEETLNVDAFMVLRPQLEAAYLIEALSRGLTHEGKLYDFMFDFRLSDRMACTEVVYRAYHGVGEVDNTICFELKRHSGRPCISAEDLIEQALGSGHFKKFADFGVDGDRLRIFP
ncbi:MAG: YiiX/YebB-like N1pC/P60 family cysteine hydrolase [Akkermansiaceae bacterium]|nr:YiiX/YebB-like N1pC/P60 family cysteine hydrolase [Akkermansiaceae bacterium]